MMLVLAYSDKDIAQAKRLMHWIGFLSSQIDNAMLHQSILLVPSRLASHHSCHRQICWMATHFFGEARCHMAPDHEVGWPGAANSMFKEALLHVEQHFEEDIFFLEPDAIPLVPDWYEQILKAWSEAPPTAIFMGALVTHAVPHMTGIAVYARDWRSVAPAISECPDESAWDVWGARQVMPYTHWTKLIQHVFKRPQVGYRVPGLEVLDGESVIFHQDKAGDLIRLIDEAQYNGECGRHPLYSYFDRNNPNHMTKYYYSQNATKAARSAGRTFVFEALPPIGGAVPGVLMLTDEGEQIAMSELVNNPTTGISELSLEEFETTAKKKLDPERLNISKPSSATQMPMLPITPTPSKSPAVLVAAGESIDFSKPSSTPVHRTEEELVQIGDVDPAQVPITKGAKRAVE